jgi:hypothetical protein
MWKCIVTIVSGILVKTYKPINGYHIEREAVLHPEGEEIELPPEKEEELPSVLEGEETEEDSPPALEGVVVEPLSVLRERGTDILLWHM